MNVTRFFGLLVGLSVVPSFPLWNATTATTGDYMPWWGYLLGAVVWAAAGWLLGFVLPQAFIGFAAGYGIGNVAALVIVWFVPESPVLHFVSTVLLFFFVSFPMVATAYKRIGDLEAKAFLATADATLGTRFSRIPGRPSTAKALYEMAAKKYRRSAGS